MKASTSEMGKKASGSLYRRDATTHKLKDQIKDSDARFKSVKAGVTISHFLKNPLNTEESMDNTSDVLSEGKSLPPRTRARSSNDDLHSKDKTSTSSKSTSLKNKLAAMHAKDVLNSTRNALTTPKTQKSIGDLSQQTKKYFLPESVYNTGNSKTPRTNPTFLTSTDASDEYQIKSARTFDETKPSPIKLDFMASSESEPFINLPKLTRLYKANELSRIQRPLINPLTNKPERKDLVFTLTSKLSALDETFKKAHTKGFDKRRSSQMSSSLSHILSRRAKDSISPNPKLKKTTNLDPITNTGMKVSFLSQPTINEEARENLTPSAHAEVLTSRVSKNIIEFHEMKHDLNDELNCNLNKMDLARNARFVIKNKKYENYIGKASKVDIDQIRIASSGQEEQFIISQFPKDIGWYKDLIQEMSTQNYSVNDGIFILLDKVRHALERGQTLTKDFFYEIVRDMKRDYFINIGFLYVLRRVSKNIGIKKKELLAFMREMKLFNVIEQIERSTLARTAYSVAL